MKWFMVSLVMIFAIGLSSTAQVAAQNPQAQIIGMNVYTPDPNNGSQAEIGGFVNKPGTSLYMKIAGNGKVIIGIDEKASKLTSFVDDKGTDLSKKRKVEGPWGRFGHNWLTKKKITKEGKACIVQINSQHTPQAKAQALALKADIVLSCGAGEKTVREENFALKKGSTLTVGTMELKVEEAGKPDWGDAKLSVKFSSKEDFAKIKSLEFIDGNGQKIDSRQTGSGSSGANWYSRTYSLQQKVDTATVSVTYYAELESVVVPVDIRTGVGLGQISAQAEPRAVRVEPRPPIPTVRVGPTARPDLPVVVRGKPEKLSPEEAKKEFHSKAARIIGTLNLPSEIIKELLLRKEH